MNEPFPPRTTVRGRILLVDDDPVLLALRKTRLRAEGFETAEVDDGACVMEALEAFRPALVILDLLMPNVSGETLLGRIRADPAWRRVKIIVSSAKNFESDHLTCLELGADAYLAKPVDHEALTTTIRRLIEEHVTVKFW